MSAAGGASSGRFSPSGAVRRLAAALPAPLGRVLLAIWGAPRAALIVAMRLYRRFVSPLYGPTCKYHPSCSAYALEAVELHGAVRGTWLTVRRLGRCNPWSAGGIDDVPGSTRWADWSEPEWETGPRRSTGSVATGR